MTYQERHDRKVRERMAEYAEVKFGYNIYATVGKFTEQERRYIRAFEKEIRPVAEQEIDAEEMQQEQESNYLNGLGV
jgi:hypothetical protein